MGFKNYLDMAGKTAIVDGENNHPVALYTVESPDVRFEDVIVINTADNLNKEKSHNRTRNRFPICIRMRRKFHKGSWTHNI
jgi:hypothetical protein